ncbi:MAG TPA: PHB depolymerase family esterase [Xanthobacteraceae bacterium]|nr:PHB depolymerase family esterase [Xanthobacteraceae bacterium]
MHRLSHRPVFCALLTLLLLSLGLRAAGAQERTVMVGSMKREFILHTPRNADTGPWPLVIALHGALQPASILRRYLDLDEVADREGFAVAYPKGLNLLWNDGRGSVAGIMPIVTPRDDGAFILAVLDTLMDEGVADPGRAYLMGFSNGAFLTAYIACRYADRFAAYATLMMTAPKSYADSCKPSRPIPILIMNGTYDPIVPMFGRPTPGAELMSANESAQFFARLNRCGTPQTSEVRTARIMRWDNCAEGSAVAFYEVEGGHQPPASSTGPMDALASVVLGPRRGGLDAPEEIWAFFQRFSQAWPPLPPGAATALPPTLAMPPQAAAEPAAGVPLPLPSPLRQRTIRTQ